MHYGKNQHDLLKAPRGAWICIAHAGAMLGTAEVSPIVCILAG